jgi:para-aminobenzoate synthetase/4-amino-4-deoxychorismate lyase
VLIERDGLDPVMLGPAEDSQIIITEGQNDQLKQVPLFIEEQLARKRAVFVLLSYRACCVMSDHPCKVSDGHGDVIAWCVATSEPTSIDAREIDPWLVGESCSQPGYEGFAEISPAISKTVYHDALSRIHDRLANGDVYQLDYTFPIKATAFGCPVAIYRKLRTLHQHKMTFLARLPTGRAQWLLSFSPEIFLDLSIADKLTSVPMKGTARTSRFQTLELARQWLATDEKNRAENLMIVDLVRNDLGKVAAFGSVKVPKLFEVLAINEVVQMTSSVEADLAQGISWNSLLRSVLPPGSVVGAPKYRAAELIEQLESYSRGFYTGIAGFLEPAENRLRAAGTFSVLIRTAHLDASDSAPARHRLTLGVGSGVVNDSDPESEWNECMAKGQSVLGTDQEISLIETFRWRWPTQEHYIRMHLERLHHSARYFGIPVKIDSIADAIRSAHENLEPKPLIRSRILLLPSGKFEVTLHHLENCDFGPLPIGFAPEFTPELTVHPRDPLLEHKTNRRYQFERALAVAKKHGCFDLILTNHLGELSQGARTNIYLKLDGTWFTPPITSGALPGVLRRILINRGQVRVRRLFPDDLARAEALKVSNAVRLVRTAYLRHPDSRAQSPS